MAGVETLLHLLIQERIEDIQITAGVIQVASRQWDQGKKAMNILIEHKGKDTTFTEDMVANMASSFDAPFLKLMFANAAHDIPITMAILEAAASNRIYGTEVMALILGFSIDSNELTEAVIESCIKNLSETSGLGVLYELCDKQPDAMRKCITIDTYVVAVSLGRKEIIGFLCQYFPQRHTFTEWIAITDLHKASNGGDTQRVQELLRSGCPPDTPNWYGETPLFSAAFHGRADIVSLLLREKVDVNAQDHNGGTALFEPSCNGKDDIVALLLEAGCRADIRDLDGRTALDLAREKGRESTVQLLDQAHHA
jgi:hypothetical protein